MPMRFKNVAPEVKSYNDKELWVEHAISTDELDRGGDVMDPEGMKLEGIPVVLWQHGQDPARGYMPIAKNVSFRIGRAANGKKAVVAKTQFPDDDEGRKLYKMVKENFLPNWSIGFDGTGDPTKNGGVHYKEWTLYEYSNVAIPMNPGATNYVANGEPQKSLFDLSYKVLVTDQDVQDVYDNPPEKKAAKYNCECIECGHKMSSEQHCKDLKCPKCGGTMRREERPGPGQKDVPPPEHKNIDDFIEKTVEAEAPTGKPYKNEHSCRKAEPKDDAEYRRENGAREHNGKKYDVIYMKDDDKWVSQSYRYPADNWTATEAEKHCTNSGGTKFEAAKKTDKDVPENAGDENTDTDDNIQNPGEKIPDDLKAVIEKIKAGEKLTASEVALIREDYEPITVDGLKSVQEIKGLAEDTQLDIAYGSMQSIFFAFLDKLFQIEPNEKNVKRLVKDLSETITPYALMFCEGAVESGLSVKNKHKNYLEFISSNKEGSGENPPSDDPAAQGGSDGNNINEPPAQKNDNGNTPKKSGLRFSGFNKPKKKGLSIKGVDLGSVISGAMEASQKQTQTEIRKLMGKLD